MIRIEDAYVAASQIAVISCHPTINAVCILLVGGKEMRQTVSASESKRDAAKALAEKVDKELKSCNN